METLKRLRKFWLPERNASLWLLFALPGLLFVQITVHEGTHTMVAFFKTHHFPKLAPFPHENASGKVRAGVTLPDNSTSEKRTERDDCDDNVPPVVNHSRLAGWIGWPQLVDLILIAGFTVIFLIWNIRSPIIAFLMRSGYLAACIDFLSNSFKMLFYVCDRQQDWAKVMIRSDINQFLFWLLTLFLWAVIFSHAYWVRWAQWLKNPLAETEFRDYKWIALALGILSALSLLLSWIVTDSFSIKKDNLTFKAGVIFEFLGLLVTLPCFWWIVTHKKE